MASREKKNVLIIGAGIHGVTIALELATNYNVTIVDGNKKILQEASGNNHNRIHLGYHYPRSIETIRECKLGYNIFNQHYKDCLVFSDFFYAIAKNSKTQLKRFISLMNKSGLNCGSAWPKEELLNRSKIADCFKVKEACVDINKLRTKLVHKLNKANVNLILNFKVKKAKILQNKVQLNGFNKRYIADVDVIINCTYTYSNNILKLFGIKNNITRYKFEETEVVVVEFKQNIPALTVVDGPYVSILPRAGFKNQYLVYDVRNSIINSKTGITFKPNKKRISNWPQILKHGLNYYPFFYNLKYIDSLFASRPIPCNNKNDSRVTRIIKHKYKIDFYSILEGKLVSAPYVASVLKQKLLTNEN